MRRLSIHTIASVTHRLTVARQALVGDVIVPQAGYLVAGRVLDRKDVYNTLEDVHGRMVRVHPGDVVVGALGNRRAQHGHAGVVPERVEVGDTLHMLNLGGVIGRCTSSNPDVGDALRLEILGAVLAFPVVGSRQGIPAHLGMNALPAIDALPSDGPPLVFVSGTCMNSGKTEAAAALVRALDRSGLTVAAAKLTGVALQRDLLALQDAGAKRALSFCDAGLPSTDATNAAQGARAVIHALAAPGPDAPDVIVAELGDGLIGEYGVMSILTQADIQARAQLHVCCAADPVGALGAVTLFERTLRLPLTAFTGPVTDNQVGIDAIARHTGTLAFNARSQPDQLGACALDALGALTAATPSASHVSPALA